MKRIALLLLLGCLTLSAPSALAICEVDIDGPFYSGSYSWYYYNLPGPACWFDSGDVTFADDNCYGEDAFDYGYGVSSTYYEFTVGIDPALAAWFADARVTFDDPNNSSFNRVKITATVTHNSTPTTTTLFEWNGGEGDLDCFDADELPFDAEYGDTVRITVEGRNWYNDTVIQVTIPKLQNSTW
jgi:hypothetical protein